MKISKLTAGGLDDADLVRPGVVSAQNLIRIRVQYTPNSIYLRVAASVCQSVGRHFGGLLLRMSIGVVGRGISKIDSQMFAKLCLCGR